MPDARIFVSYARADGAQFGRTLSDRLTRDHGFSVWRDLADLEGGSDWWRQIAEAIDHVEYLVLVMTPAALSSDAVRDEWRYARQRGVCVVPVIGLAALDFSRLPEWMRRAHFVDPREPEQWIRFIRTLESPCRTTRVPMMAEPPPDDFVARSHEFAALRSHLASDARGGSVAIAAALKGAGGYGKTTLARAICHDHLIRETYYDGVLWLTLGEQPGDPAAHLEDLIVTLTGRASQLTSTESRKQRLTELLADRNVLIVIDDVWNAAHLHPFLVGGNRCAQLITTRDSQTLPAQTIEVRVDAMNADEAVSLLSAGIAGADRRSLAPLATELGEWPLLLKLVNRMLRDRIDRAGDTPLGAIAYVTRLLERRGYRAFDARDPLQRQDAASAALEASVRRLTRDEQARLRELVIFPEDVDIPLDTVALLWKRTGGIDEVDTETCARTFFSLSLLLDFNLARRRIRIHDVIRHHLASDIDIARSRQFHGELVEAYRSRCDGLWSAGVDDGYFYRFLPYHLAAAGHASELRELLLEPSWIEAKLRHGDIVDILEDYGKYSTDRATQIMADAIRLSADILAGNADEVIPQLLGRIDGGRFPEFTPLLDTWRGRPRQAAWLCPQTASLVSPGGALLQTVRVDGFTQLSAHSLLALAMSGEETSPSARQLVSLVPHLPDASFDGRLVVHGAGGFIELFDTITRQDIWTTQCPDDYPVVQVALTPDARYAAASAGYWMEPTGADAVHVWHVESRRQVFAVARGGIHRFLISPDARQVVIQMHGGLVEVWSVESGEQMARWQCGQIAALVHGVERDDVVVATTDGTVNVWTLGRDSPRTTIVGNNEQACGTAVTSDARTVVRAFIDRRLECHRLAGDRLQANTLRPPGLAVSEPIRGLVITDDGRQVISSEAGAIRMWNLAAPAFDIRPARDGILISMTPDGRYQVVQDNDGRVACRDEITSEVVTLDGLYASWGYFSPPDITPDGDWVVYRAADGSHKIWDTSTGAHVVSLTDSVLSPAITCDSRVVYLRRGAGLWTLGLKPHLRLDTARPVRLENVDPADIISLAVVPGSPTVIILTTSGAFSWHLDETAPRRVVARDGWQFQRQNLTTGLHAVRADDRWLFAWGWQEGEVWDMHSASMVLDFDFDAPISTAAFSPAGRGLLVAVDRFVTLWDIKSGLTAARFTADAPIHAIGCPSDTSFIAASSDGRVHRLDVRKPVAHVAIDPIQRRGSRRP
jgi:WD40 repeat protein